MRIGELLPPVDVHELSMIEAQSFINNNPHLVFESAYDNTEYRNKIDTEKLYTIKIPNLVKNQQYAPIEILGVPTGKYIGIKTTESSVTFIKEYNNRLWFRSSTMKDIMFPAFDTSTGDQCTDILIFNDINDREQFLMSLKLSFTGWQFKTTNL